MADEEEDEEVERKEVVDGPAFCFLRLGCNV